MDIFDCIAAPGLMFKKFWPEYGNIGKNWPKYARPAQKMPYMARICAVCRFGCEKNVTDYDSYASFMVLFFYVFQLQHADAATARQPANHPSGDL